MKNDRQFCPPFDYEQFFNDDSGCPSLPRSGPELDGVLAIAISFGWFLLHGFFASQPPSMPKLMQLVIGHGWLGVDLFFVLSGFLITGILLDAKGKEHYLRTFYTRRFLRIMPVYFAVGLICSFFYRGYASYFLLGSGFMAN